MFNFLNGSSIKIIGVKINRINICTFAEIARVMAQPAKKIFFNL